MATAGLQRVSRKGRPNHPVEFKRRLAQAACAPGISVAKLAQEHRINTNLLFKWRRHYRAGTAPAAPFQLLPVIESVVAVTADTGDHQARLADGIEVVFPVATVRVGRAADPVLLRTVLDCLARRR
jgi:transposase